MSDKTPLERDIERNEQYKIPVSVTVLIVLLLLGLGVIGVYTFDLKQKLLAKDDEIKLLKTRFRTEKVELLSRMKKVERQIMISKQATEDYSDRMDDGK